MILAEFSAAAQNVPTPSAPLSKYATTPTISLFSHKMQQILTFARPCAPCTWRSGASNIIYIRVFRRVALKKN